MQTPRLQKEDHYKRATEIRIGEMECTLGIIKMLLLKFDISLATTLKLEVLT
jgi:hypothetical protein